MRPVITHIKSGDNVLITGLTIGDARSPGLPMVTGYMMVSLVTSGQ